MALKWAVATGNWSSGAIWNGGTLPAYGDEVHPNNFQVTIDIDFDLGPLSSLTNWPVVSPSVNAGGFFLLTNGRTIVVGAIAAHSVNHVVQPNATTFCNIICQTIIGGTATNIRGIHAANTGVLNITAVSITGGSGATANGLLHASTGIVNITASVYGGIGGNGIGNNTNGTLIVNGTVYSASGANIGTGALNSATGTLTVNGPAIAQSNTSNAIAINGNSGNGASIMSAECGPNGEMPVNGRIYFMLGNPTFKVRKTDSTYLTLSDPSLISEAVPPASDVRHGVSYLNGDRVGSCRVPPKEAVSAGVLVDNTVGEAVIKPDVLASILVSLNV